MLHSLLSEILPSAERSGSIPLDLIFITGKKKKKKRKKTRRESKSVPLRRTETSIYNANPNGLKFKCIRRSTIFLQPPPLENITRGMSHLSTIPRFHVSTFPRFIEDRIIIIKKKKGKKEAEKNRERERESLQRELQTYRMEAVVQRAGNFMRALVLAFEGTIKQIQSRRLLKQPLTPFSEIDLSETKRKCPFVLQTW